MKPPTRILLALDTGDGLADVWREGVGIAKTFGAKLVVVHAIPEAGEWSPEFGALASRVIDLFSDLAEEAKQSGVEVVRPFEVHSGTPTELILTKAKEREVDMIVLGAAVKTTIDRILLGSTAEALMREAPVPVWLVRPGRGHDEIEHILCAVDDSEPGRESLNAAVQLARTYTAKLSLLHVVPKGGDPTQPDTRKVAGTMEAYDLHGIDVETLCVEGPVPEAILKAAADTHAELVIVGEAGRTGLARLLNKNTAEAVVRKVPCSLLAVKAQG